MRPVVRTLKKDMGVVFLIISLIFLLACLVWVVTDDIQHGRVNQCTSQSTSDGCKHD